MYTIIMICVYETTLHVNNNKNNTHSIYCIILYVYTCRQGYICLK